MKFCSDMCIICFAPKRFHSQWLFTPPADDSNGEIEISEIGLLYQELLQISLSFTEERPEYVCQLCKEQLHKFHKFKLKAWEAHRKVSNELYDNNAVEEHDRISSNSKDNNVKKVEEVTVFDISTKKTEKYEIQYLNDQRDEVNVVDKHTVELIEIEENKTESELQDGDRIKYECKLCPKFFYSDESLQVHIKIHNGLPAYQCQECVKTFKQKVHFEYHMLGHRNERNIQCHLCGKSFLSKSDLGIHLRVHNDERRYECDVCGKRFRANTHMTNHRYSHFDKQLECSICLQKYSSPHTLRTHIKAVHKGECPYECEICRKKFKRKHHLKAHYETHLKKGKLK